MEFVSLFVDLLYRQGAFHELLEKHPVRQTLKLNVANTSDMEWMASDTMAPECPRIPANNLNEVSKIFPKIPTVEI